MDGCVFCKIVSGEVPSDIVYRNENLVAFKDIHPKAPVHILIVPIKHLESLRRATREDQQLLGDFLLTANQIAEDLGIEETGYRLIINTGKEAGQAVPHLHLHLMGGKNLP